MRVYVVVHGDDFTVLGTEQGIEEFRRAIGERFPVKLRGRLGIDVNDDKSAGGWADPKKKIGWH